MFLYICQPAAKDGAFEAVGNHMMLCQTVALLEVLNAAIGLVKSNPLITFIQVKYIYIIVQSS